MHATLVLVPVCALLLWSAAFWKQSTWEDGLLGIIRGYLLVYTFVALSTELLSSAEAISFGALLGCWLLLGGVGVLALRSRSRIRAHGRPASLPAAHRLLLAALALMLTANLMTALVFPPNTWDSMTYHMSRVAHWIDQGSVAFFPTDNPRQNYQMPLAEYAILHLQILTGADRFANVVQWAAYLVAMATAFLIARELGLTRLQGLVSALLVATMPMAILQASSTQNDLVVGAFVAIFALSVLRLAREHTTANLLMAGASLGLALLTKGTAYLYCGALALVLGIPVLYARRSSLARTVAALAFVGLAALALNAAHLARNVALYGHPFSTEVARYRNETMTPATLYANTVRNAALHAGTPFMALNRRLERRITRSLGAQANNPKTTWSGTTFTVPFAYHEDHAGNPIHAALLLLSILCLPYMLLERRHRTRAVYFCAAALGALLYCGILKWQPWGSRLHTPFMILFCPVLVAFPSAMAGVWGDRLIAVSLAAALAYGSVFAIQNESRPLQSPVWSDRPRDALYFTNRPDLYRDFVGASRHIVGSGVKDVGLHLGVDDWEYPLWAMAGHPRSDVSFRHVWTRSMPQPPASTAQDPELVVFMTAGAPAPEASGYRVVFEGRVLTVARRMR